MKRTVRAWACVDTVRGDGSPLLCMRYKPIRAWLREHGYSDRPVPCTITYDDGRKPRRGKK